MLLRVPQVLSAAQVVELRKRLDAAGGDWVDGRVTAGSQGAQVKRNQQIAEHSRTARELGDLILAALERNPLFVSGTLPNRVYPPMFNRYETGMNFGTHVDNAVRLMPHSGEKIRTDISVTLFLSDPDSYDGGELVIDDTYGAHSAKLPAGDALAYPACSLHRVQPVTRGLRLASFFWVQSLVADDGRRTLLFELDTAIQRLRAGAADGAAVVQLTGVYHNLLRQWTGV